MKPMPPQIEDDLRRLALKKGWSQVEYAHVRELTIRLLNADLRERERKIESKINKAA